jgi:aspartokinase-like uncharacterized kinase
MWVAKVGGSLAGTAALGGWLRALRGAGAWVVVPGGGPFADQVRRLQRRWGFGDPAAHRMAVLAMEQYGHLLCDMQPGLRPAATADEIREASAAGATPVWMPAAMVLADPRLPASWALTADSLAAWLCARLGAGGLLLVKAAPLAGVGDGLEALAARGLVDPAFPAYARAAGVPVRLASIEGPVSPEGWLARCAAEGRGGDRSAAAP